jgi:hypothetical protein
VGVEDLRPIVFQNQVVVVGNTLSHAKRFGLNDMIMGTLSMQHKSIRQLQVLTGPDPLRVEKNWIPVEYKGKLCAIYRLYPLMLVDTSRSDDFVQVETPTQTIATHLDSLLSKLRGSSTLIPFQTGWLGMFHTRIYENNLQYYVHHLVHLEQDYRIKRVSQAFTFEQKRIEYCMGIAIDTNETMLTVWYTIYDEECSCRDIPINKIQWTIVE